MPTHYLRNAVIAIFAMRNISEAATSAWVFAGNEVKYFFRSVFSFLSKVLWLKNCGLVFIFQVGLWDFLGGTPETTGALREERECGVQNGSESTMF